MAGRDYHFDQVLGEATPTEEVYSSSIQGVVHSALEGVNATVLAYGQTGSGKTYTIMGAKEHPGVISLAIDDLFAAVEPLPADACRLKVDMLELYNEELRDLLAPALDRRRKQSLQIQEDAVTGTRVVGAYEEVVSSPARMKHLFERGNNRRQTSSHHLNAVSSRSHAIFQVLIERKVAAGNAVQMSTLNFVDLAGSERLDKSGNEGEAARHEATNINLSLLMLGNVISKLAE
eukprot:jgi/Astpho2/379/e_gw1.00010.128.1_t